MIHITVRSDIPVVLPLNLNPENAHVFRSTQPEGCVEQPGPVLDQWQLHWRTKACSRAPHLMRKLHHPGPYLNSCLPFIHKAQVLFLHIYIFFFAFFLLFNVQEGYRFLHDIKAGWNELSRSCNWLRAAGKVTWTGLGLGLGDLEQFVVWCCGLHRVAHFLCHGNRTHTLTHTRTHTPHVDDTQTELLQNPYKAPHRDEVGSF